MIDAKNLTKIGQGNGRVPILTSVVVVMILSTRKATYELHIPA